MLPLKILIAQINTTVGAVELNTEKIIQIIKLHCNLHDVIVFPELTLTGYPPQDLLLRKELHYQVKQSLKIIKDLSFKCHVIVGHPDLKNNDCFNAASVFSNGRRVALYYKQHLPNYGVFDEKRYFMPGEAKPCIFSVKGYRLGVTICEDLWCHGPVEQLLQAQAHAVLSINSSPFDYLKFKQREKLLFNHAVKGINVIYVNQVGGQDELVFDGKSLAYDNKGKLCFKGQAFQEECYTITLNNNTIIGDVTPYLSEEQLIYKALVCGTHDYIYKNAIPGVLLGVSGGIDSALTLAIAVDALGAAKVHPVLMPSHYTADISLIDAKQEIAALGLDYTILDIESTFRHMLQILTPTLQKLTPDKLLPDITEENLQARIRGIYLMALANKTGKIVLTTSNKSETAVGFNTLYGDMVGGFAVLKDVLKSQVYTLAKYRNTISPIIPQRVITRIPTAELAENQADSDSLPTYDILDGIIQKYIVDNMTIEEIVQSGYSSADVHKVIHLIAKNEFKRQQSAIGIKISAKAFDRDWRYPITSGFQKQ